MTQMLEVALKLIGPQAFKINTPSGSISLYVLLERKCKARIDAFIG